MTLHPTPESVSRARRWFLKFIAPYDPACSVEDCALMISELVTNAIVYGRSDDSWFVRVDLSPFGGTVVSFTVAEAWPD
ncbi:hypothetical protein GTY20_36470 [Streptomyces sp. SID4946]|nr:hypothetical protein [Streptomyces sp. CRPSP2-6A1]MYQ96345.1 hypothetical protein [Streptomyces sp. SID4946]SCF63234.1 hypothetical protein GA0115258_105493 [Streptomyces sp. LamerLS-31b]SCG00238.1 hypothetical protein GA0115256_143233 [Streptomyces sp. DconLS]